MEIEVGEYVRLKNGYIVGKVIEIVPESGDETGFCEEYVKTEKLNTVFYNEIVNHSKNIIDLIEVGDIVECFVEEDIDGEDTIKYEVAATEVKDINGNKTNEIGICGEDGIELIPVENVRSILTHEQYNQNCYRLEE